MQDMSTDLIQRMRARMSMHRSNGTPEDPSPSLSRSSELLAALRTELSAAALDEAVAAASSPTAQAAVLRCRELLAEAEAVVRSEAAMRRGIAEDNGTSSRLAARPPSPSFFFLP